MWKQIQSRNSAWLHSAFSLTSQMTPLNLGHHKLEPISLILRAAVTWEKRTHMCQAGGVGGVACDRKKQPAWHHSAQGDLTSPLPCHERWIVKIPKYHPLLANPRIPANNSHLLSHYRACEEPDVTILLFILFIFVVFLRPRLAWNCDPSTLASC